MARLFTDQSFYFYISHSDEIITPHSGVCQQGISVSVYILGEA